MSETTPAGILDGVPADKAGTILAMKVTDAVNNRKRADLAAAHEALDALFRDHLAKAPKEVRDAVLGRAPEDSPLAQAYLLGQISVAQTVAATELTRRPAEGFEEAFEDPTVTAIIDTVGHGQMSVHAIARETGFQEGVVRSTLHKMTGLGISDWRRGDGEEPEVEYFMTPVTFMMRPVFHAHP